MEKIPGFTTAVSESVSMKYKTDEVSCETQGILYVLQDSSLPLAFNQSRSPYVNLITLQQTNNFITFFPFDSY